MDLTRTQYYCMSDIFILECANEMLNNYIIKYCKQKCNHWNVHTNQSHDSHMTVPTLSLL